MAAYNSGPGTVQAAVKRTGYADFWELYRRNVLPKETRNYVPIIVAVTIMAKNPEQYGLDAVVKEKPVPYDTVKINYPIDLRLAAECVDATASDLQDLNPSLLRLTTPKDRAFDLHLPAGTADKFQATVASIPVDKRVSWRYHKVQAGETLASISRTYRIPSKSIAAANNLDDDILTPESKLVIPMAPSKNTDTGAYARATTRYRVRKGDTVESVAENFGVSAKMLRGWNRLKGSSLAGRKVLFLHLPVAPRSAGAQVVSSRSHKTRRHAGTAVASKAGTVHHKVKRGETLASIANSYNTTVSALKHDNRNIATLRPGMILVVRDAH
jgi:membrane-bound lytic murein transglycosylase D